MGVRMGKPSAKASVLMRILVEASKRLGNDETEENKRLYKGAYELD